MECTGKSITDICLDAGVESQRTFLTGYLVKDMMFVFTKMLLSFGNNSSAAVESVDATVVEKKQGIYTHMQSEAHVPWFRVVFEMTDGSLMEFQM